MKKLINKIKRYVMYRKLPKCCQECKQPVCDENGMIYHQRMHGNELSGDLYKCGKLDKKD
jgi:hypothetical protein